MFHVEQNKEAKSLLLRKIVAAQIQTSTPKYNIGLFPSQRFNAIYGYSREDDNIFFSSSIVYILNSLRDHFDTHETRIVKEILERVNKNYPKYRNKNGLPTYNFWQTLPPRFFPNGLLLHRLSHFKIPDDLDVTSLIYLNTSHTSAEIRSLQEMMQNNANLSEKEALVMPTRYRKLKAYSTFFVKKMRLELDFGVLCNTLTWVFNSGQELNEQDMDALLFLELCVTSGDIWASPKTISMSYPTTALLLYHLARLMHGNKISLLEKHRVSLLNNAAILLSKSNSTLNKLLISTAILKWGGIPAWVTKENSFFKKNDYFFVANMIAPYGSYTLNKVFPTSLLIKYRCEALFDTLLLENHCLSNG